ncbi:hypothetical protein YK48G_03800 [Lentilactobacillus fungorum]|uniref:Holin n=2 Tax=Lentilactobacillus fungorum TaxID=2201250 RepID=A0ABQ3VVQ3_9LACO|nr:hypothetical protein YK48G_03800 [Lentilactobacillus fungorum]
MFNQINDVFNWLESTGILAALGTLVALVIKQLAPYLKTHIKDKQLNQLTQYALQTVIRMATLVGLSKSDRQKAAIQEVTQFAQQLGFTWVTPTIVTSLVEAAYQQFKKLGYDNHAPKTTIFPDPDEPATSVAASASTSTSEKPVQTATDDAQAKEG